MSGNPYAGFFYILTVIHAVHVLGGMIALGSFLLRSWMPTFEDERNRHIAETLPGPSAGTGISSGFVDRPVSLLGFLEVANGLAANMELLQIFPHLNATLNAASGVFSYSAFISFYTNQVRKPSALHAGGKHRFGVFPGLLYYVSRASDVCLRPWANQIHGRGLVRPIYFTILTSHTLLGRCHWLLLFYVTLYRALKGILTTTKGLRGSSIRSGCMFRLQA